MASRKLSKKKKELLRFLQEKNGKEVTTDDILAVTGWKEASWKVYVTNGLYDAYLQARKPDMWHVTVSPSLSEEEFARATTQSDKRRRGLDSIRSKLVRNLLTQARHNAILALEVFNRPSLPNRVEAFSMLFCAAWEQLLKAEIATEKGEKAVYKTGDASESIGIRECIRDRMPKKNDVVRRNLEYLVELRNKATHLVLGALEPALNPVLQSSVVNFSKRFKEASNEALLARSSVGLLSLIGEPGSVDRNNITACHDQIGAGKLLDLASRLTDDVEKSHDDRFAIRIEHLIKLVKGNGGTQSVSLSTAADAPSEAILIEKPTDPAKTHPYRTEEVVQHVGYKNPDWKDGRGKSFNSYHFQVIAWDQKWKARNSEYHFCYENPEAHKYSESAVERILVLLGQPNYIGKARQRFEKSKNKRGSK